MNRQQRLIAAGGLVACMLVVGVVAASLTGFDLRRGAMTGGGGRSSSAQYALADRTGPLVVGESSSNSYRLKTVHAYRISAGRLLGDVTDNGEVTAYDAAHVLRHSVGVLALTGEDFVAAEVSGDGTISAFDASLVLQHVVGTITRFPVEEGGISKGIYAVRTVWMGEIETAAEGGMRVPILIDEMDGVVAGELTLVFEGNVGDEGDVGVSGTRLSADCLFAHNVQDGRVRVAFAGAASRSGSGPILQMWLGASRGDLTGSLKLDHVSLNEGSIPVRVAGGRAEMPRVYRLAQNYPNPFNPETVIHYDIAGPGTVRLDIYTLNGQRVRTLVSGDRSPGRYSVTWDGRDDAGRGVGSSVYLCRMEAGAYRAVRKVLLVR